MSWRAYILALCGLILAADTGCQQLGRPPVPNAGVAHPADTAAEPEAARKAFIIHASRALLHTYDDDRDEEAPIQTAWHQLNDEQALAPLRDQWREPLALALTRCQQLGAVAPRLRLLRRAFASCFVDELTGTLEGIDVTACQEAWQPRFNDQPELLRLVVTIEPLGPQQLGTLKRLCRLRQRPPAPLPTPSESLPWSILIPSAQGAPSEEP